MKTTNTITFQTFFKAKRAVADFEANFLAVPAKHETDFFAALASVHDALQKYDKLVLVLPLQEQKHWNLKVVTGFLLYCLQFQKTFSIIQNISEENPVPFSLYIAIDDADVAGLLKKANASGYKPGKELGLISFYDSPIKKYMGITVVKHGEENSFGPDQNWQSGQKSFYIIRRGSI